MKTCKVCGESKPVGSFPKDKKYKDGLGYLCLVCKAAISRAYYRKHGERYRLQRKQYATNLREKVLSHYSGGDIKCVCCGEREALFMSLDHVDGGGNKERAKVGGGTQFLHYLIKSGYPSGYQVLCHNCNMAKGFYGKCPHGDATIG